MNYRHAYHAGNFADVLKHAVVALVLAHLKLKETPFRVIDTHAGRGLYDLSSVEASKTGEWRDGIGRLLGPAAPVLPAPIAALLEPYLRIVTELNSDGEVIRYPGSPCLVSALMRPQDRLIANELHAGEADALATALRGDRRAKVLQLDAWLALKSLLPPLERRGLVLIDPPFEAPDEYERLLRALRQGVRRFATGCYAIWYPIKDEAATAFAADLASFKPLVLELKLDGIAPGKLAACGLAVINPPWRFEEAMLEALPWIAAQLGPGVSWAVDAAPATPAAPASSG